MWHLIAHLIGPLLSAASGEIKERNEEEFTNVVHPFKFLDYLRKMGYYDYAEVDKIEIIRDSLSLSLAQNKGFIQVSSSDAGIPFDFRIYNLNGESLSEKGGLISAMKRVKHTFDKMGIPLLWTNESLMFEGNLMDYRISLNGKEYKIYKGDKDSPLRAGLMKYAFAEMLNDQLKRNNSKERVYLISNVKEGMIVFLTKKMHLYIEAVVKSKHVQALEPRMWSKWNGII